MELKAKQKKIFKRGRYSVCINFKKKELDKIPDLFLADVELKNIRPREKER